MPPEELGIVQGERLNTYSIGHNEYALVNDVAIESTLTSWIPLRSNTDDLASRLEELGRHIMEIQERLDKLNIDADELGILKEQVSLLDLLKSDTESN